MSTGDTIPISQKRIFSFWIPLAATWMMMAAEGPFITAIIARLDSPENNLAAWGVAFVMAIIFESPIIMMMSAATALVKDRHTFFKLRNFTFGANVVITVAMLALLFTPAFEFLMLDLIGLPEYISELVFDTLVILLPWPAAIGYRRFYQGLLIRDNKTRLVALGTVVRMGSMAITASVLYALFDLPGAQVGAFAASTGVLLEALTSRLMAVKTVKKLLVIENTEPDPDLLSYGRIIKFYLPLAATSVITISIHPLITFFVGNSRFPLESLAVLPVVNSMIFIFRAFGISFQEVGIALLTESKSNLAPIRKFAWLLGLGVTAVVGGIAFSPLAKMWFTGVAGLSTELAAFALLPVCLQSGVPFCEVMLAFQRSILVSSGRTTHITLATVADVGTIIAILFICIQGLDMIGATAASAAMLAGRIAANIYLVPHHLRAIRVMDRAIPGKDV